MLRYLRLWYMIGLLVLLLLSLLLVACSAPETSMDEYGSSSEALIGGATLAQVIAGQNTFNNTGFAGNGRRCSSCHTTVERTLEIGDELDLGLGAQIAFSLEHSTFDLTPEFADIVFAADPSDGLFRTIDSDDGAGLAFDRLRDGLIRVNITLHPNVHVEAIDPADAHNITTLPDGTQVLTVLRSPPSILNIGLEPNLMWDGRAGRSLEFQAGGADGLHGAVGDHFEPGRAATSTELANLAAFQRQLYSRASLASYAAGGPAPSLPPCTTAAECRGRTFFESTPILITDMAHRGLCATCHSGPMLNETNEFNPVQPPIAPESDGTCGCVAGGIPFGPQFTVHTLPDGSCPAQLLPTSPRTIGGVPSCVHRMTNNVVAERNNVDLPEYLFSGVDPVFGPISFQSPDLGHIMVSGNLCEVWAACFLNPGQTQSIFRISSLWGVGRKARFFHDNSATTLEGVLEHAQDFFHETAVGLGAFGDPNAPAFEISEQDAEDMVAYLRLL